MILRLAPYSIVTGSITHYVYFLDMGCPFLLDVYAYKKYGGEAGW